MRVGLVQLTVSDDVEANLIRTRALIAQAAEAGAQFILTPECTNLLSSDRGYQAATLRSETDDLTLQTLRGDAQRLGVHLLIGSLAIKTDDLDGRFANRSYLIGPQGEILARYDKIHMFDVTVSETESYRESAAYRPGTEAITALVQDTTIGMAVCYDVRFPYLFRVLAKAGAQVLTVPAAFNDTTGAAHWHILLRARAIETGCFVLAPAQCGLHPAVKGNAPKHPRRTYGHSLVISPWGEILADAGPQEGITVVDLDLSDVAKVRGRIPSITHDRPFAVAAAAANPSPTSTA
ncbi:carbon-nitrogen hydrolase family protein [Albirhodobacter sp. R86504]|uniref:carbon-nitrogen hydrolase family protein n=1 Tax=Albirhodobacter sp. R86504 TaxID=3093848 RepID=UPI00366EFEF5